MARAQSKASPHGVGQEGTSELCTALNRSRGQRRAGRGGGRAAEQRGGGGRARVCSASRLEAAHDPGAARWVGDKPSLVPRLQHVEGLSPLPPSPGHHGHRSRAAPGGLADGQRAGTGIASCVPAAPHGREGQGLGSWGLEPHCVPCTA